MSQEITKAPCQKVDHDHFAEWCQMTGWHGVLDFYIAKHKAWKIVWLVVVLASCFFAINQSVSMIIDYATDDQWITSITYEMPKQGYLEWPNITVCPIDWPPVLKPYDYPPPCSNDAAIEIPVENIVNNSITTTSTDATTLRMTTTLRTNAETQLSTTTEKAMELVDVPVEIPTTFDFTFCPNVVLQCGIQKSDKSYVKQKSDYCCNSSELIFDEPCFNLRPNFNFGSQNKNQGSRIFYLFDANSYEDSSPIDASSGFEIRLYLGKSDSEDDFSSSFFVQPGTRNVISMILEQRKTTIQERPIRFSKVSLPCNKPYAYLKTKEYTQELCVTDCAVAWQIKYCKCFLTSLSGVILDQLKYLRNCTSYLDSTAEFNCGWTYTLALQGNNPAGQSNYIPVEITPTDEQIQTAQCAKQCPEPCSYRRVEAKISSSLFLPPNKISKKVDSINNILQQNGALNNFTDDQIRKLTMLELYYEMKQQRLVEKQPKMSIDDLISNIGGCLGVWSGISFLSLFQIGCYLFRAIEHFIGKRRAKRIEMQRQKNAKSGQANFAKMCYYKR